MKESKEFLPADISAEGLRTWLHDWRQRIDAAKEREDLEAIYMIAFEPVRMIPVFLVSRDRLKRIEENADKEIRVLEPTCPECGVGVDRPKCPWDLDPSQCPRHSLADLWREMKRLARIVSAQRMLPLNEELATEGQKYQNAVVGVTPHDNNSPNGCIGAESYQPNSETVSAAYGGQDEKATPEVTGSTRSEEG